MRTWLKRLATAVLILLIPALLILGWLGATESGLRWLYRQAVVYVPGELSIDQLDGRLLGTMTARGIHYRHQGAQIGAKQLRLRWRPGTLLAGGIHIRHLQIEALDITLPPQARDEQPTPPSRIELPEINLPWRVVLKDVRIDGLSIRQDARRFELDRLTLSASSLLGRIDIARLGLQGQNFVLNIEGELQPVRRYRHRLDITWQADLPSGATLEGGGHIRGDVTSTQLQQRVQGPLSLSLTANARDLLQQLDWQAEARLSDINLSRLDPRFPAISGTLHLKGQGDLNTATLSGDANGVYADQGPFDADFKLHRLADNTLNIESLVVNAPDSDTRLNVRGEWRPGDAGGQVALDLDWHNLRWPLKTGTWFSSANGEGRIEGGMDQYRLTLTTDRPWPQVPPSTWHASATGNLAGMDIDSLRIITLNGEALASGRLRWTPHFSWQANARISGINPGELWPEWPGKLDADLVSKGQLEHGQWLAAADISRLSGRLRDYPVSLRSRLGWRQQGLDIDLFRLRSGDSRIILQGRLADTLKLDWSVDATDLAELYPHTRGRLRAQGRLQGARAAPVVDASFNGEALQLPDVAVGSIDGELHLDLFRWQQPRARLLARGISFKTYQLRSLQVDGDPRQLQATAEFAEGTARLRLTGRSDAQGWRGQIEQATIRSHQFGDWHLIDPGALSISQKRLSIESSCWQYQAARLCGELQKDNGTWQARFRADQLPLELISPWLPRDLRLEGVTHATAEMQFRAPGTLLGEAHIAFPAGAVSYPLVQERRDRWHYRSAGMALTLDEQRLDLSTRILMSNGDQLVGELTLPGFSPLVADSRQQPLRGRVQLNVHDLGIVEALVPEVYDLKGELGLTLLVSGTLDEPGLSGSAYLRDGALRVPRLGLKVDPINLSARSDGVHTLSFSGDAGSGNGRVTLRGRTRLDRSAGWPTTVTLQGQNLEVSRIPEARVEVSPDLQMTLEHRTLHVTGEVHIPYANLQPRDITTAAQVSDDAVIVGGDQPPEEKWRIFSEVRVTLGDRISFFGYGFDGRLGGSLLLKDEPGQITTATGNIAVEEGRYQAYGQRLEVEHGQLLYTGSPLSNPGLDLRAVRKVNNVTAGLRVKGTLKRPQVELFSVPAMDQTDALAYLLLGRPLETASGDEGTMMARAALALSLSGGDRLARTLGSRFGLDEFRVESSESGDQASLVVGRYLSPRLYISYGVGLIESFNTLNVRYQISDHWQLKGESGENQGADLLYTIER